MSPLPHPPAPLPRPQAAAPSWPHEWTLPATGTTWRLLTREPVPPALGQALTALVDAYEGVFSRFSPGSLLRRAATGQAGDAAPGGRVVLDLPAGSARMLDLYDRLHAATSGRLDPLVGSDLVALGYDERCTLVVRDGALSHLGAVGGRPVWGREAHHDGDRLVLERPALVDVGAVGKGLLIDLVGQELEEAGVDEFVIDGSGDLLVRSAQPVRLGLEEPRAAGAPRGQEPRVVGVVELSRAALCASGPQRRSWGPGLHHLLDALTGLPVRGAQVPVATWAVADDAATADGLATALFLADPADLAAAGFRYDFALLRSDGSAAVSRGFAALPGELFTA
ncbi:FAD:protein FMN transferase [Actinomyces sp. W5033]|uniref:FAD:protein FMN transferase n=1 Tax=Actinomyces sp. W5033 TaxID=3446479 RepID=UPI003EE2A0F5